MYLKLIIFYISVVISVLILFLITKKHKNKVFQQIQKNLDYIFFKIATFLETNKKNILKYDEFVDLLFKEKEKFLQGFHYGIEDFDMFWKEFQNDILDANKILNEQIISQNDINKLNDLLKIGIKIEKINKLFKSLLCVITFWIFCFFKN